MHFIEVNSRPYMKMHHYPRYGEAEDFTSALAELDSLEVADKISSDATDRPDFLSIFGSAFAANRHLSVFHPGFPVGGKTSALVRFPFYRRRGRRFLYWFVDLGPTRHVINLPLLIAVSLCSS